MLNSNVLWIGDHHREEFARIASGLSLSSSITFSVDGADVASSARPGLVLLAHSRPGEFESNLASTLATRWPQGRFVHLLGELCSGWKRTSTELGEYPSVYTHELPDDVRVSSLLDAAHERSSVRNTPAGSLAVIYSPSKSYRRSMSEALRLQDVKAIELSLAEAKPVQGADFVVWDASDDPERRAYDAELIRKRHPQAKVVALLTYPREFELESLRKQGISVLAQPFALNSLFSFFRMQHDVAVTSAA